MKYLTAIVLAAVAAPAFGQGATPDSFLTFASQVVANIDHQHAGLVWDRASPMLKKSQPKDRFVARVADHLQKNGTPVSRQWYSIARSAVPDSEQPNVQRPMVTVTFITTTNKGTSYNEIIQFVLGADNLWHTAGYSN